MCEVRLLILGVWCWQKYDACKHHWSDTRLPVLLEVTPYSLNQLDLATNHVLASYCYKDIEGMAEVKDYPGGFVVVCGGFGRMVWLQESFTCSEPFETT
jgi:hypothetical protein